MMSLFSAKDRYFTGESRSFGEWALDLLVGCLSPFHSGQFWKDNWLFGLVAVVYFATSFWVVQYATRYSQRDERNAWILSLSSSLMGFALGVPLCLGLLQRWVDGGFPGVQEYMLSSTPLSSFLAMFFFVYVILDTMVSVAFFRDHFDILTGYLHHGAYFFLMSSALYWNFSMGVAVFFIEELPTMVFSLGRVAPRFHSDIGFGLCFIVTRIIYHVALSILCTLALKDHSLVYLITHLATGVHLFWLAKWLARIRRLESARKAAGLEPEEQVGLVEQTSEETNIEPPEIAHPPTAPRARQGL